MEVPTSSVAGHLQNDGKPKRMLTLDGGGLRGVLTLGFLARIEDVLRGRHGGNPEFRLSDYFDLIAGTSTGAIIATALAQGWSVGEIREKYFSLGELVFERSPFRQGIFRAKYDDRLLTEQLKELYGADTTLGSDRLLTGLLIITKRLDTESVWPLSNNPEGRFFDVGSNGRFANRDYLLWQVVRASTAAPSYFEPETITINGPAGNTVTGNFIDGGVSPFNNPALQALMYATIEGYRISWPTGADKLLLVSVGTGSINQPIKRNPIAAGHALNALTSVMKDCAMLQETLLQWMSTSVTAHPVDREVGTLKNDLLGGTPLVSYLRYDLDLGSESITKLDGTLARGDLPRSLGDMDAPKNMDMLHSLGLLAGKRDVSPLHFPPIFDRPENVLDSKAR